MPSLFTRLCLALAAAACVSACGEDTSDEQTNQTTVSPTETSITGLDGTWFVSSYAVGDVAETPGRDTSAVVDLNIELMSLEGAAGCGTFFGSFTFGTSADPAFAGFTIPGRTSSTCEPEVQRVNDLVIAALEGTTTFSRDGENVLLTGPSTTVTLTPAS